MCQIYDCYTYTVLVTLEDYGICAKGEGGALAADGALAPGGSLPVNTGGGQLSAYYMWGFTPLSEAVIQARGDGGARQSPATDIIIVSGNGGILAHHGALILSPHPPGSGQKVGYRGSASRAPGGSQRGSAEPESADQGLAVTERGGPEPGQPEPQQLEERRPEPGRPEPAVKDGPDAELTLAGAADFGVVRDDPRSAPFFQAAGRGQLMIKRCEHCGIWLAPTASSCPRCDDDADELSWVKASGRGELVSWSVVHSRQAGPVAVPALVELAEGPWLATGLRLRGPWQLGQIRVGQPLAVEFVRSALGASYPVFRPVGSHRSPAGDGRDGDEAGTR
jgi:uncharacterized OB-fold protein